MSNRSPGVYWQVRLPDLWSDPGLPVDFSSSFPTQMQTIPWSEPWFIHVFLPIGPSQYFPTKIQHPCPHLFFLPRPAKCKSHKFTRNIQKQSPKHPKASPKYPPKNLRTSKSQIFGLQVFLLQFPGFSRSKNRKHLSPLFFSFVPSPGTEELQALAESTEKVTAELSASREMEVLGRRRAWHVAIWARFGHALMEVNHQQWGFNEGSTCLH